MKCSVFIATEVRVHKVGGHFYASHSFAKTLENYKKSFEKILLATRIINVDKVPDGFRLVDNICFAFDDIGSLQNFLLKRTPPVIIEHIKESDLVVLRLHSVMCLKVYRLISKFSKKYMVEMVGCAWDAYWNHGVIGRIIAPFMFFRIKWIVKRADYCIYVTRQFLQNRYPCDGICVGVSDVSILGVSAPKKYSNFDKNNFTMMTAAGLNVKYKGQQYVIRAIHELRNKHNINIIYYLAGSGDCARLKKIVKKYGVKENVIFLGMLSHEELAEYMRMVDFYIQPSLQEGLPRSLVEAMSLGDVCLGANTGGIPELLARPQIFKRKRVRAIEYTIIDMINSNELARISEENIKRAKLYLPDILEKRRQDFFKLVKKDVTTLGGEA